MKLKQFPILILLSLLTFQARTQTEFLEGKYLLVIDLQEINTKHAMDSLQSENLLQTINKVIATADTDKVIYVESLIANLGISFSGLSVNFEPGLALDDRLLLLGDTRVVKNKANAFSSVDLKKLIAETGAADFVIIGLMAEHCVRASALGALKEGYKLTLIPEAIAAKSDESKTKIIAELEKAGAKILSLSEI